MCLSKASVPQARTLHSSLEIKPLNSDLPQYQGSGTSVSTMARVREGSQEGLNEQGAPTQPRVRGGDRPPISPG